MHTLWEADENDMAVAKAACEPFIQEEFTAKQPYAIEPKIREENTYTSTRTPLKRRWKKEESYHRLPYAGLCSVIEQYECYFKIEISLPFN